MPITYRTHYDARDGQEYQCVLMPDGKWWSARNLSWQGAGCSYNGDASLDNVYGRYYPFISVDSSIPANTHAPSYDEIILLKSAIGFNPGKKLKADSAMWLVSGAGTDDFGFFALPTASMVAGALPISIGYTAGFFSSTSKNTYGTYGFYLSYDSDDIQDGMIPKDSWSSVRFIVDKFVPPPPKLFGVPFQGFERGLSCAIKRQIIVDDSMGGPVVLTPVAPAAFDEWAIEAELWVSAAQAQALEATVPPYGVPLENAIRLPPRGGEASFPGLLPYSATAEYDQYATPMVTSFESLGRKAPGVDLLGYRISFSFFAEADGFALNASPTPTTTPPTWLAGKFSAHQLQDWSNQGEVVAATTLAGHPSPRGSFYPIKHGRRRDVNFNLDHLSTDRANELVALFRGVRHSPVTINMDCGPEGIVPTSVYLVDLSLQRGAGLWWDGTLKAVLA